MPNLRLAELCRFPRICRELHAGCFSLPILSDTLISIYTDTFDAQIYRSPNFAGFSEYSDARFRRSEKKLSPLVNIGSFKQTYLFALFFR